MTAVSRQPSAISRQPSAVSRQPSAVSHQPSAISRQPSAISRQPSAVSVQPTAYRPTVRPSDRPSVRPPIACRTSARRPHMIATATYSIRICIFLYQVTGRRRHFLNREPSCPAVSCSCSAAYWAVARGRRYRIGRLPTSPGRTCSSRSTARRSSGRRRWSPFGCRLPTRCRGRGRTSWRTSTPIPGWWRRVWRTTALALSPPRPTRSSSCWRVARPGASC